MKIFFQQYFDINARKFFHKFYKIPRIVRFLVFISMLLCITSSIVVYVFSERIVLSEIFEIRSVANYNNSYLGGDGSINSEATLKPLESRLRTVERVSTITRFSPDIFAFDVSIKNYTGFFLEPGTTSSEQIYLKYGKRPVLSLMLPAKLHCTDYVNKIQEANNSEELVLGKGVGSINLAAVIENSNCVMVAEVDSSMVDISSQKLVPALIFSSPTKTEWRSVFNILFGQQGQISTGIGESVLVIRPDKITHVIVWLIVLVFILVLPSIIKEVRCFWTKGLRHFYDM